MKNIQITTEYIKLGQFLKFTGIIGSGSYEKEYLLEHKVYVNSELEQRRGRKIYPDYIIRTENQEYKVIK
ncbi:MAG: RNA-binding S4 domain-containing protein [Bacilli bacterium]